MNRMNTLLNPETARGEAMSSPPGSGRGGHAADAPSRRGAGYRAGHSSLSGQKGVNIASGERDWSLLAGVALVGFGLWRRSLGGVALAGVGASLAYRGVTGHCGLYEALGVNTAKSDRPDPATLYDRGVKIEQSVTVNKPPAELYEYWRNLSNLPSFMPHVKEVREAGEGRTHWTVQTAANLTWEFEAEVINDEPSRLIAWRTIGPVDVHHAGSVRFVELSNGRGTEVRANIEYLPPAGFVGRFGAKVLRFVGQAPKNDVHDSLLRFKSLMETGEVATTTGQPQGCTC